MQILNKMLFRTKLPHTLPVESLESHRNDHNCHNYHLKEKLIVLQINHKCSVDNVTIVAGNRSLSSANISTVLLLHIVFANASLSKFI